MLNNCNHYLFSEKPDNYKDNSSEENLYYSLMKENQNILNFLVNISHDLRTPISVILNAIKVLIMQTNNSQISNDLKLNQLKYLTIIQQNSYRLIRLFNSILQVLKIESGSENLNLQNLDIVEVIFNICASVKQLVDHNNIVLEFSSDLKDKVIAIDPDKIERIILNLLTNSFKYTKPGGKVCVHVTEVRNTIIISVKDTGSGIPKEELHSIFDKYHNGNDSSNTFYCKGVGVGLFIVKSFVELHNGSIDVTSKEGLGTEFKIKLPIRILDQEVSECVLNYDIENNKIIETINVEFSDVYKINQVSVQDQTAG